MLLSDKYFHYDVSVRTVILFVLQTAYTVPILAFAFVCHPEVLPIYTELRKYVQNPPDVKNTMTSKKSLPN